MVTQQSKDDAASLLRELSFKRTPGKKNDSSAAFSDMSFKKSQKLVAPPAESNEESQTALPKSKPQPAIKIEEPNSRIFIGNLASEKTSTEQLRKIFSKYGEIVEIVLRRSFGFVQYSKSVAAQKAIQNENGREIGGLKVGKLHFQSA